MALTETEKLAQIETSCGRPPPPKMAQFEPKSLALTDRNHWHKSNRISQPQSGSGQKDKNGYYIAINFEKFDDVKPNLPKILLIRFGYLEHTDWIAQTAATGQQARLSADVYNYKLKKIYPKIETK